MKRSKLLALLSLGGAFTGTMYMISEEDSFSEDGTQQTNTTRTQTPNPGNHTGRARNLAQVEERLHKLRKSKHSPSPRYNFDYGQKQFTEIKDSNFEAATANARPDLNGDRLQLTPGNISAQEMAARLRIVWGVDETKQVTRTIRGTDVTFKGGVARGYAFLVGVATDGSTGKSGSQVLVARSKSLSNAKKLTQEFKR
jgi:hypothetical protein